MHERSPHTGRIGELHWLFGYGSLIWRPDFPYVLRQPALLHGWTRRFWQGSHDHRGLPHAPGRVVTLIEAAEQACVGMAYALDTAVYEDVVAHLDVREKNGYARPVAMQNLYNLIQREEEREMNALCLEAGVGLIPY